MPRASMGSTRRMLVLVGGLAALGAVIALATASRPRGDPTEERTPEHVATVARVEDAESEAHGRTDGNAPEHDATRYVVAIIGDSLSDPKSHGGGWVEYLRERCPESRFDNYARGGTMVNQMRARLDDHVFGPDKPEYTHAIVFGGVNDLISANAARRTLEKITADLAAMYAALRDHDVRVVALTLTPWGGGAQYDPKRYTMTTDLNDWILTRPDAGEVETTVDVHTPLRCGHSQMLCEEYQWPFHDNLHFGPKGQDIVGQRVHERVFEDCR